MLPIGISENIERLNVTSPTKNKPARVACPYSHWLRICIQSVGTVIALSTLRFAGLTKLSQTINATAIKTEVINVSKKLVRRLRTKNSHTLRVQEFFQTRYTKPFVR